MKKKGTTIKPPERTVIAMENIHDWLRRIRISYFPGYQTKFLEDAAQNLLGALKELGNEILDSPLDGPDLILTTAPFGEPVNWREALLFTARRRFHLEEAPLVFTLIHVRPADFQALYEHFEKSLASEDADPSDYNFPGLAPMAYHTLHEQGRRGGPLLSIVRLLQSQSMSVRIILIVGEDEPLEAYTFDLVGSHPRTPAADRNFFYRDLALRMITAASTEEVTNHESTGDPIPFEVWRSLSTPAAMLKAGRELGQRRFFTEMVRVANLVQAPAVHESVSSQYSEGCFATWDPDLGALITTITGSARPVEKDNLGEDELAIICGLRPNASGALLRFVEGKRNDPPSSEAVEMLAMDLSLPKIGLGPEWGESLKGKQVPVTRSKLHGHRGVSAFDPTCVEHVYLDTPYYYYPVSCSTEAQAQAIRSAFAHSEALQNPRDPRQVVFTVMPGHGTVIVEKWVPGKEPFQTIWEYMDEGKLRIENIVPQGLLDYIPDNKGQMVLNAG
jgi:hypothetical protein